MLTQWTFPPLGRLHAAALNAAFGLRASAILESRVKALRRILVKQRSWTCLEHKKAVRSPHAEAVLWRLEAQAVICKCNALSKEHGELVSCYGKREPSSEVAADAEEGQAVVESCPSLRLSLPHLVSGS